MAEDDNSEGTPKGKRDRSPNFPALTFTEALEATKKIWAKEKRHPMSLDLASQHLEYKAANGASMAIIAAMKRYGLMVASGKDLRISDDAHTILVYPDGVPERTATIRRLAMMPALFGEVLAKFPDGLPSDANLQGRLQHEWKFASPKAADTFIKALKEAVELSGNGIVAGEGGSGDNGGVVTTEDAPKMTPDSSIKQPPPAFRPAAPPAGTATGVQMREWDLGDGAIMTIGIPRRLSPKNVAKLRKYIDFLVGEAAIAWDDEPVIEGSK